VSVKRPARGESREQVSQIRADGAVICPSIQLGCRAREWANGELENVSSDGIGSDRVLVEADVTRRGGSVASAKMNLTRESLPSVAPSPLPRRHPQPRCILESADFIKAENTIHLTIITTTIS